MNGKEIRKEELKNYVITFDATFKRVISLRKRESENSEGEGNIDNDV